MVRFLLIATGLTPIFGACMGGQMARALGLALYLRSIIVCINDCNILVLFLYHLNEVSNTTIGDASSSVLIVPSRINAVYSTTGSNGGGSGEFEAYYNFVPKELQTVKSSISEALHGFIIKKRDSNVDSYFVKAGADYPSLVNTFYTGVEKIKREDCLISLHIDEVILSTRTFPFCDHTNDNLL